MQLSRIDSICTWNLFPKVRNKNLKSARKKKGVVSPYFFCVRERTTTTMWKRIISRHVRGNGLIKKCPTFRAQEIRLISSSTTISGSFLLFRYQILVSWLMKWLETCCIFESNFQKYLAIDKIWIDFYFMKFCTIAHLRSWNPFLQSGRCERHEVYSGRPLKLQLVYLMKRIYDELLFMLNVYEYWIFRTY